MLRLRLSIRDTMGHHVRNTVCMCVCVCVFGQVSYWPLQWPIPWLCRDFRQFLYIWLVCLSVFDYFFFWKIMYIVEYFFKKKEISSMYNRYIWNKSVTVSARHWLVQFKQLFVCVCVCVCVRLCVLLYKSMATSNECTWAIKSLVEFLLLMTTNWLWRHCQVVSIWRLNQQIDGGQLKRNLKIIRTFYLVRKILN